MRKSLRKSWVLLLCIMMAVVFSGCSNGKSGSTASPSSSGQASGPAGSSPASPDNKVVELSFAKLVSSEQEKKLYEDLVQQFMDENPNIKIKLLDQTFPGLEQQRTWITTQLIGGTAPEIFQTKFVWDQEDLNKGLVLDLTKYYQEQDYTDSAVWKDTFIPDLLNTLKGADGSYASVPIFTHVIKILYNKDLFKQAGVDKVPDTWNEFLAAQKKIQAFGKVPFALPNTGPSDFIYGWSTRFLTENLVADHYGEYDVNGDDVVDINEYMRLIDMGIVDITKPPFNQVQEIMKDWSQYWEKGYNGTDTQMTNEMFIRGDAAMIMASSFGAQPIFESQARNFELGVFTFPRLTKENSSYSSEKSIELGADPSVTLALPANIAPDRIDAAVKFIKFLTSPKVQAQFPKAIYTVPATVNAELPEELAGWKFTGTKMKLNIYNGSNGKNLTEANVKYGQLYLEGSLSLDKYLQTINQVMLDEAKQRMKDNNLNKDNNWGIK